MTSSVRIIYPMCLASASYMAIRLPADLANDSERAMPLERSTVILCDRTIL